MNFTDKFLNEKNIEDIERLDTKVSTVLNEQIKIELNSSLFYRNISCWLDDKGWPNASKYYFKSAQEELTHMDMIYKYLFEKNVKVKVYNSDIDLNSNFKSIKNIIEDSLQIEMNNTKNFENISEIAKSVNDWTTVNFCSWFLKEQIEEEEKFRNLLFKINLDIPNWELENIFATL